MKHGGSVCSEKVSLIIPAYNAGKTMRPLLESIAALDYPGELTEVIVVDNSSRDKTREIVEEYPVVLLEERDTQSSYAARNKGIRSASGGILAFIDADCTVHKDWLRNGVAALGSGGADLVAGNVVFARSSAFNIFEFYDSHMFLQQKYNASVGASTTANLLVKKSVFDAVGLFPAVQSGGDVKWTKKATDRGFAIAYCEGAMVFHPTRKSLRETVEKEIRLFKSSSVISSLLNPHCGEIKGRIFIDKRTGLRNWGLFAVIFLLKNTFKYMAAVTLVIDFFGGRRR